MDLDDIKQILDLVHTHDLAEFELERDGLKIRVRKANSHVEVERTVAPPRAASIPVSVPMAAPEAAPAPAEEPAGLDLAVIKSPIVGTFYRSSEPGARPFVEVGDLVKKGQVLCIIEAMKLMNEIESETDGEIGKAVQFGERLFAVRVGV